MCWDQKSPPLYDQCLQKLCNCGGTKVSLWSHKYLLCVSKSGQPHFPNCAGIWDVGCKILNWIIFSSGAFDKVSKMRAFCFSALQRIAHDSHSHLLLIFGVISLQTTTPLWVNTSEKSNTVSQWTEPFVKPSEELQAEV